MFKIILSLNIIYMFSIISDMTFAGEVKSSAEPTIVITGGFFPDHIFFEFESYKLSDTAIKRLNDKALFLKSNVYRKIVIEGNADDYGSNEQNYDLGLKRAEEVYQYLIKLGVSQDRMRIVSYGDEIPWINNPDNPNEKERIRNRRVTISTDNKDRDINSLKVNTIEDQVPAYKISDDCGSESDKTKEK